MNNEKKGAIGLLFIFLIITAGVLAYSLPSNIYSPQRGSATEVSLMEYSNSTNTLFLQSHVFINSPKPTDVIVIGAVPFRMISAQPPADISDGSVSWEGVFSKRSQLYFKNETYTDLYYEASVPFENTIEITSGANSEGTNYDDLEFYNLKMVIYLDRQMPIAIPEPVFEYDY